MAALQYICGANSKFKPWPRTRELALKFMRDLYFVNENAQLGGEHEVHRATCGRLPALGNRKCLGFFENSKDALREARKYYSNVDGCYYCCPESHSK